MEQFLLVSPRMVCKTRPDGSREHESNIKSGRVSLIQMSNGRPTKHTLYVKICRDEYKHSAQLYTHSDYKFMYGFINLRKCAVYNILDSNQIVIYNSDKQTDDARGAHGLTFEIEKDENILSWLEAFKPVSDVSAASELSPLLPKRTI